MIATHVSRPIRSASASGPSGWAKPSLAIVSIASGLGDAVVQRPDGLVDERHQDPVRDEAGEVVRDGRRLAELARELGDRAGGLVRGLAAADDLHELQHGHRVEEVHADDLVRPVRRGGERARSGSRTCSTRARPPAAASSSARRKSSSLTSASSTTASIIRSAGTRSSTTADAARARRPRAAPPFSSSFARLLRIASSARLGRARLPRRAARRGGPRPRRPVRCRRPSGPAPTTSTCSNLMCRA